MANINHLVKLLNVENPLQAKKFQFLPSIRYTHPTKKLRPCILPLITDHILEERYL